MKRKKIKFSDQVKGNRYQRVVDKNKINKGRRKRLARQQPLCTIFIYVSSHAPSSALPISPRFIKRLSPRPKSILASVNYTRGPFIVTRRGPAKLHRSFAFDEPEDKFPRESLSLSCNTCVQGVSKRMQVILCQRISRRRETEIFRLKLVFEKNRVFKFVKYTRAFS